MDPRYTVVSFKMAPGRVGNLSQGWGSRKEGEGREEATRQTFGRDRKHQNRKFSKETDLN